MSQEFRVRWQSTPSIYLVTVLDYESTVIIGAFSTRKLAEEASAKVNVVDYGRIGPFVFPLRVDASTPVWSDGDSSDLTPVPEDF